MAEIWYTCEFCTRKFKSRKRRVTKLCHNCIGLRRLVRGWVREGVWVQGSTGAKPLKTMIVTLGEG